MNGLYRTAISLLAIAIIISLIPSAQANVVKNPGFEKGSTDSWAHWSVSSVVIDQEKHAGSCSVELGLPADINCGALLQEFTSGFSVGKPLYAAVWVKTDSSDVDAVLKVEFWNKDGYCIKDIEGKKITGTSDWTKLDVSASSVPADTTMVKLLLQLSNNSGSGSSGKVYFDDAYLDTVAPAR